MRLLVVEDEPNVAAALAAGLSAEGFEVDVVSDGETALRVGLEGRHGLIVLDVLLPKRNGFLVCRGLRDAGILTPILMLTAKSGEYDQAEGLDTGADDYLTKPFSFVVLAARVRALLRRHDPDRGHDIVVVGDLQIDRGRRSCRLGDEETELTGREFALLDALAGAPGQVRTKASLVDEVWGTDFDGGENVVEVYVGYLRRKLGRPGAPTPIETVHGYGYRLAT